MTADETLFLSDLQGIPFRSGMERGRWGFPDDEARVVWPHCVLWIEADSRFAVQGRVALRFTLDGYPAMAPNAVPWDCDGDRPLAAGDWPSGPGNVSKVFNPNWNNHALYAPCDRIAMQGHEAWKSNLGQWWWTPDSNLTLYLEFIHRCLNPLDHET